MTLVRYASGGWRKQMYLDDVVDAAYYLASVGRGPLPQNWVRTMVDEAATNSILDQF